MKNRISFALMAMVALATPAAALAQKAVVTTGPCYRLPATANNVTKGDIILTTTSDTDDPIKALLNSIGQNFTHTGIALSATRVRHNTMDTGKVVEVSTAGITDLIPERLKAFGSKSLRDGDPGIVTSDIEGRWLADASLVLTGHGGSLQTRRHNAADEMARLDGHYRLYAYTNMTWKNPTTRSDDDGNMCSGTIAYANMRVGNLSPNMRIAYDESTRAGAAEVLYSTMFKLVEREIKDRTGWRLIPSKKRTSIKRAMANQVVNCMAFNRCDDTSERWRNDNNGDGVYDVGTGSTISPDDLIKIMQVYALVAALDGTDNAFAYHQIEPARVSTPVYCCTTGGGLYTCS